MIKKGNERRMTFQSKVFGDQILLTMSYKYKSHQAAKHTKLSVLIFVVPVSLWDTTSLSKTKLLYL